jgi:hypothetical protein
VKQLIAASTTVRMRRFKFLGCIEDPPALHFP